MKRYEIEEKLKETKELEDRARSYEEVAAYIRVEARAIRLALDDEHDELRDGLS